MLFALKTGISVYHGIKINQTDFLSEMGQSNELSLKSLLGISGLR